MWLYGVPVYFFLNEVRLLTLKTLNTIGNCQRPVFSLGVSQQYAYNNKPVKILVQLVVEVVR